MRAQTRLKAQVTAANISHFNRMSVNGYRENEAVFGEARQQKVRTIFRQRVYVFPFSFYSRRGLYATRTSSWVLPQKYKGKSN